MAVLYCKPVVMRHVIMRLNCICLSITIPFLQTTLLIMSETAQYGPYYLSLKVFTASKGNVKKETSACI